MQSDIQRMSAVKADVLTTLDDASPGESASAIADASDYQDAVVAHNLEIMAIDGWIHGTQELDDDVLIELTETGEDLLDLVAFGDNMNTGDN